MTGTPNSADTSAPAPVERDRNFEIAVNGLIGAYDMSAAAALQTHILQVLARVGVDRIEVMPGTPFDPAVCEAVSTEVTGDPDRYQRVVEMVRPGWRLPDAVLRAPQVSVWVADSAAADVDPIKGER